MLEINEWALVRVTVNGAHLDVANIAMVFVNR
jgi:hypothetical protein